MEIKNKAITYEHIENIEEDIISETSFFIYDNDKEYFAEAYYTGEHDTYAVRVFKLEEKNSIPTDSNCICVAYLDSCGGGCADEQINTGNGKLENEFGEIFFP